jgi:transposase
MAQPAPHTRFLTAPGRTTKIHAIVDACGRPIALEVIPGQLGDVRIATALISAVPPGRSLAGDAAYDSDGLRRFLLERGTLPVIPNNPTRKSSHPFDQDAYRQSHRTHVLSPKGLATHRNPLRQARNKLRRRNRNRSRDHLVDLIESRPLACCGAAWCGRWVFCTSRSFIRLT